MATWVMCKLASSQEKFVYINLDQVASITDRVNGAEVVYGSGNTPSVLVAGTAFDLLAKAGMIPYA